MRLIDKTDKLKRRNFLSASVGAVAITAISPLASGQGLAETLKSIPADAFPMLVKMARDIYPHDRLPDIHYELAVQTIDGQVSFDETKKNILADGAKDLDAASIHLKNRSYLAIENEADRVEVLKSVENTPFFRVMQSGLVTALYNQQGLWKKFGYEGSSAEKGGYLHRGFNDIDWLPA